MDASNFRVHVAGEEKVSVKQVVLEARGGGSGISESSEVSCYMGVATLHLNDHYRYTGVLSSVFNFIRVSECHCLRCEARYSFSFCDAAGVFTCYEPKLMSSPRFSPSLAEIHPEPLASFTY